MLDVDGGGPRRSFARYIRMEMIELELPRALLMGINLEITASGILMSSSRVGYVTRDTPWLVDSLSQKVLHREINSLYSAMTGKKWVEEEIT